MIDDECAVNAVVEVAVVNSQDDDQDDIVEKEGKIVVVVVAQNNLLGCYYRKGNSLLLADDICLNKALPVHSEHIWEKRTFWMGLGIGKDSLSWVHTYWVVVVLDCAAVGGEKKQERVKAFS